MFQNDVSGKSEQFVEMFKQKGPDLSIVQIDENEVYSREVLNIQRNYFRFYEVFNCAETLVDRVGVIIHKYSVPRFLIVAK